MRLKVFIILLTVFIFSFAGEAQAQTWDNRFDCAYDGGTGECYVNNSTQPGHGCSPGYQPDASICSSIGDNQSACNDAINNSCIAINPEEETRWTWDGGACIPSPDGEFATYEACSSSHIPSTAYKCVNPSIGCQPCNPASDASCTLNAAQCAASCTTGSSMYRCDTTNYSCQPCQAGESGCSLVLSSCQASCRPPAQSSNAFLCNGDTGIDTAIGCIPYDPIELTKFFLGWALGIGGGIALLMIGWAGISLMTSSGDPKKAQGAQQLLTAAVSGLLLIIFSTFILRLFGVTLFGIF